MDFFIYWCLFRVIYVYSWPHVLLGISWIVSAWLVCFFACLCGYSCHLIVIIIICLFCGQFLFPCSHFSSIKKGEKQKNSEGPVLSVWNLNKLVYGSLPRHFVHSAHRALPTRWLDRGVIWAGYLLHHACYDWTRYESGKWPYAGVSLVAQDAILGWQWEITERSRSCRFKGNNPHKLACVFSVTPFIVQRLSRGTSDSI